MVSKTHIINLARSAPYFSPFSFQLKKTVDLVVGRLLGIMLRTLRSLVFVGMG